MVIVVVVRMESIEVERLVTMRVHLLGYYLVSVKVVLTVVDLEFQWVFQPVELLEIWMVALLVLKWGKLME